MVSVEVAVMKIKRKISYANFATICVMGEIDKELFRRYYHGKVKQNGFFSDDEFLSESFCQYVLFHYLKDYERDICSWLYRKKVSGVPWISHKDMKYLLRGQMDNDEILEWGIEFNTHDPSLVLFILEYS